MFLSLRSMASFLPPSAAALSRTDSSRCRGGALRFSADDLSADEQRLSNSNALVRNLETEMGRLLEWAGAGGGEAAARRDERGPDEPSSAAQRRQDLHAYLDARADVRQKRAKRRGSPSRRACGCRGRAGRAAARSARCRTSPTGRAARIRRTCPSR